MDLSKVSNLFHDLADNVHVAEDKRTELHDAIDEFTGWLRTVQQAAQAADAVTADTTEAKPEGA